MGNVMWMSEDVMRGGPYYKDFFAGGSFGSIR